MWGVDWVGKWGGVGEWGVGNMEERV